MFVFYLDQCNTALWKAFFLGSWVVAMIRCYWTVLRLLSIPGDRRALRRTGVAGPAFERMKPKVSRRALQFLTSLAAAVGLLLFYVAFYETYVCTPDSIFWAG